MSSFKKKEAKEMEWIWIFGIVTTPIIAFLIVYFVLAPRNLWFTFVKEGTAKIIVRGDKFEKALIQWKGHTFDDKWKVIPKDERHKEPWHPLGGFRYYGFWPIKDIYIYDFQWTGVKENGEIDPHPKETLDYVLLKDDVYLAKVEKAEDINRLPLDLEILLTIRIDNPHKALFTVQNWLETVINRSRTRVRNTVTAKSYEDWITDPGAIGNQTMDKLKEEGILEEEFIQRYGVEIRAIEIKDINPPEDYREATLKKYLAEMEREKILVEADAEKQRIKEIYGAIDKFGDPGKLFRSLEAMETSKIPISTMFHLVPGLEEAYRGVLGKAPEQATKEDIKKLKETLKKLTKEKKS